MLEKAVPRLMPSQVLLSGAGLVDADCALLQCLPLFGRSHRVLFASNVLYLKLTASFSVLLVVSFRFWTALLIIVFPLPFVSIGMIELTIQHCYIAISC